MKKFVISILIAAIVSPAFAGVIKESQAKREVDDAIEALAAMDARADLATFLPQREAYSARTYHNKARNFLADGDYDKASFYAILSTNYSKISVYRGLLAKADRDKLERAAQGAVVPSLKTAGLKGKGKSDIFAGTYTLKTVYNVRSVWRVDKIPALHDGMTEKLTTIAGVMKQQGDVKMNIETKARSEEISEKYAKDIKDFMIEKGIDASRIEYVNKKGRDSIEITLSGVKH